MNFTVEINCPVEQFLSYETIANVAKVLDERGTSVFEKFLLFNFFSLYLFFLRFFNAFIYLFQQSYPQKMNCNRFNARI